VVGEHWKHFTGIGNMVYISIHYGIAAGIIINDELVAGSNGTMGEIAHMPLFREYNPQNIQDTRPGLGPFESQVDITGITNMIKKELKSQKEGSGLVAGKDIDKIDFDDICTYYNDPGGDNPVKKIIDGDTVAILSRGIATIIAVIDTNTIIINGKIICLGEAFIRRLTDEIYRITPFKPEIVVSGLKEDAPILGAVKFGMNHMDDLFYHRFFSL
jgi:glucokinase